MNRRSEKLLREMSPEELASESEWHAAQASELFGKVKKIRKRALSLSINEAVELMRLAMEVAFEAEEHLHHANVLDSVRASRLPYRGTGLVVPASGAYTARQNI